MEGETMPERSEREYIAIAVSAFSSLKRPEVIAGVGEDDCAVVKLDNLIAAFTADSLHEKADFPPQMEEWEKGHMCLAVNLSDIAAMGAEPAYFMYTVTLSDYPLEKYEEFCLGLRALAEKYGTLVLGGDTDSGDEMSISGFAVGFCRKRILLRRNAKAGDRVYITGITGKAQLSLEQLLSGMDRKEIAYPEKLYTPEPRVKEGLKLAEFANSCTDVSDSLAVSLHQIAEASKVRIDLTLPDLSPLTEFVREEKAVELFLYAGGDYELVYTCEECDFGIEVGRVVEGRGVYANGKAVEFRGYTH